MDAFLKLAQLLSYILFFIVVSIIGYFSRAIFTGELHGNSIKKKIIIVVLVGTVLGLIAAIYFTWIK